MYLGAPFTFAALQKWPKYRRYYAGIGLGTIAMALVASSYSTRLWHLILTQGVLYGVGLMILDVPALLILNTWFVERRGLAYETARIGSRPLVSGPGLGWFSSPSSMMDRVEAYAGFR